MTIIRYEPVETGTGPDILHEDDFLLFEDHILKEAVWQHHKYTGEIGDKLPYVHGDAKQAWGQKALYLLRWKDSQGITSDSKTTFDPEQHDSKLGRIEVEFNDKWYSFKRVNLQCRTKSTGRVDRYIIAFYEHPKAPELMKDHQGRWLTHNAEIEMTPDDILDLATNFEVWINIRDTTRYLMLDRKGARFHQR